MSISDYLIKKKFHFAKKICKIMIKIRILLSIINPDPVNPFAYRKTIESVKGTYISVFKQLQCIENLMVALRYGV